MARPNRNDPCHCGSGRKYKKCHLEADEAAGREARAADEALIPRMELETRPLGARFWILAPIGIAVAGVAFALKDMGAALIVAAAWALGMVAWAVIRDPPPPRPDADDPAALNFGVTNEQQGNQPKVIEQRPRQRIVRR
ncbi:MAG: SEC-C metal-binding domain-containing protein [bacterium]